MTHKRSGLWCDLCGKPILDGDWWHIGINGKDGHCHDKCKEEHLRKIEETKSPTPEGEKEGE